MFRPFVIALAAVLLFVNAVPAHAMNCVAYVRSVTGFNLSGDAWQWWASAEGIYNRVHLPEPGSVMVFQRTHSMRHGHVAVVRDVVDDRHILIDQANWVVGRRRGLVTTNVAVEDVSDNNDWSQVRVEWLRTGTYGRVNGVSGFILPDGDSFSHVDQANYLTHQSHFGRHLAHCAVVRHHGHHGAAHLIGATLRHHRGARMMPATTLRHHGHQHASAGIVEAAYHPHHVHHVHALSSSHPAHHLHAAASHVSPHHHHGHATVISAVKHHSAHHAMTVASIH